jgi:hypothetical protein
MKKRHGYSIYDCKCQRRQCQKLSAKVVRANIMSTKVVRANAMKAHDYSSVKWIIAL